MGTFLSAKVDMKKTNIFEINIKIEVEIVIPSLKEKIRENLK